MQKIPCSVEILTFNSGKTLVRALESVRDFSEIIVLDGGSTDNTLAIAQEFGAKVLHQRADGRSGPIEDFSAVRNRGVAAATNEWVFFIDSDEYASKEIVQEIKKVLAEKKFAAFKTPRVYVLNDTVITQAATYPNYQLRLFHTPDALGFQKKVHEQIKLREGKGVGILACPIYVPLEPLPALKKKWRKYIELQLVGVSLSWGRVFRSIRSNSIKFCKYLLKLIWIRLFARGEKMPVGYEWENAIYHVRLPVALIKKVLTK